MTDIRLDVLSHRNGFTLWQATGRLSGLDAKAPLLRQGDQVLHASGLYRIEAIADGPRFDPRQVTLKPLAVPMPQSIAA